MEDKTEPDSSSLFLINLLSSPFVVFTGLAVLLLLFTILSGLFLAAETGFRQKLKPGKPDEPVKNDTLNHFLNHSKRFLATFEVIQTFLRICIGLTISLFFWQVLKDANPLLLSGLTAFNCLAAILFGGWAVKLIPANKEFINSPFMINVLFVLSYIFYPISSLKMLTGNSVKKTLTGKGYLKKREEQMESGNGILKGAANFSSITVKQVMCYRMDITAFDIDLDFHELLHNINKYGFSRVPVFRDTIDRIEGILYLKDVLPYIGRDKNFPWQNLLRPAYFVPESKKIEELLKEFQEKHNHIALVVDEYGGISGLITLEDILEEIVGEINDELDEVDLNYIQLDERTYIFEGKTSLTDFSRVLEIDATVFEEVKGESESLGGLLLQINSNLPKKGDKINFRNFVFRIDSANNKRVKKVRVHILEEKQVSNAD